MKVKKFLSMLLVMAMVISLLPGISPSAEAAKVTGYTITNDVEAGEFAVSGKGGGYETLAEALAECVPTGGEGVPNIQFGSDADNPLTVNAVGEDSANNELIEATYSGWVKIEDGGAEPGFGLTIKDTDVTFNGLVVTTYEHATGWFFAVAMDEGSLTVEDGTDIAVSGSNGYGINAISAATVTMTGGTITATGTGSCGIAAAYSAAVEISGGTVAATGEAGVAVRANDGTVNMTGGTLSATGSFSSGLYLGNDGCIALTGGSISGVQYGIYNESTITSGNGAVFIGNGAVSSTGTDGSAIYNQLSGLIKINGGEISASGFAVYNSRGTIEISGGALESTDKDCIYTCGGDLIINGGAITSKSVYGAAISVNPASTVTISGTNTVITSFDRMTILIRPASVEDALSVNFYGVTIHGSTFGAIGLRGEYKSGSGTYVINNDNRSAINLWASDFISGKSFYAWMKDAALADVISNINGAAMSSLTTGANEGVTKIYLRASDTAATYRVSGTVSAGTTGAALSSLRVKLYSDEGSATSYTAVIGSDGTYTIDEVPAGTYTAVVEAKGKVARSASEPFTVSSSTVTGADIALETAATYSVGGTVSAGTTGASVSGLSVTLYSAGTATSYTATTGSGGTYTIDEVPAGTYAAVVATPTLASIQSSSNPVTVSGNVTNMDVVLAQYVITHRESDAHFQVNGVGEHETLNAALQACTGAVGTTVIQLGGKGVALYLPDLDVILMGAAHDLVTATYTGNVQFRRCTGEEYYGLRVPTGTSVIFKNLALCDITSDYLDHKNYGVYVKGGSLTVESGSITVNGRADNAIYADSGSVTVKGGTLTAAATDGSSIVLYCGGTASATVSGGTLEACGKSGAAIVQASTGTITVTGGIVKASYSDSEAQGNAIAIGANAGKVTVSGGTVSSSGIKMTSAGISMVNASNSVLEISGSASVSGAHSAVSNISMGAGAGGTVNIIGGILTSTGSSSMTILNFMGTFNISGGKIISQSIGDFSSAVLNMNGTSAHPSVLNVSGSAEISSAFAATIVLYNMSGAGAADLDSSSATLFGKTVYGSNKAQVIISGEGSSPYVIKNTNHTAAKVLADDFLSGNTFVGWTKDAARNSAISTTNPVTLSNLTTGANSSVTSIYLKTETVVAPDYTIISGSPGFTVGSNTYTTLAEALAVCTNKGSDGVLTIQLGDGSAPLQLTAQGLSGYSANVLIPATYTGAVQISGEGITSGVGLVIGSGSVVFNGLDISAAVSASNSFSSVLVALEDEGAALTIKSGTFSASGANSRCVENQGSLVINGGTFTSAGAQSFCVYNRDTESGPSTLTVNGGTFSASGKSCTNISNDGKMSVTGGNFTAGNGAAQESSCIKSSASPSTNSIISGGSLISNDPTGCGVYNTRTLTISGGVEIVSASADTILMSKSTSTTLFGKTIHGSTDGDISVMGAVSSSGFKIASSNYADAALIASALSSGKSFAEWTSDSLLTSEISSINGDKLSALTTGANAGVTDIYLKTGTDTAVVLASASLGTAGDKKVTGLTAGTKHKVTMGSVTYYAKADGTLSPSSSDAAALTGTEIKGLTNGTAYKVKAIASGGGGGSYTPPASNNATVIVGGNTQTAGTAETTTQSGKTTTTVTVSTDKLKNILEGSVNGATVTIPIMTGADTASGRLDGQAVKDMENKDATLVIKTGSATYTLPASEINIDSVSNELGKNVSLGDITVNVTISAPSEATVKVVERTVKNGGYSLVAPAVEFTVSCTYSGCTVEVSAFNSYVERLIAIPNGVDPSRITTGIVVDPDGTVHHVPTEVIIVDGKFYAKINSLTNSVYSVIYNPVTFSDVETHWAKDSVNNMGSRLVVNGVGNNTYAPDRSITRAEFAAVMVKALGLAPGTGTVSFDDVSASAWYCGYVETASSYRIIKGYDAATFGPNDTITREQAMTMLTRAMKLTGLDASLTEREASTLLTAYSDSASASSYAKESIAACLKTGIVSGTSGTTISPKADITRAEVAVMAERLLQKSGLIES